MKIYALSGPSGTGKSDSALVLAHNKNISAIIDDGLLIYKGHKIAGTSAKYEANYVTAIKRATFYFEDHKEEVIKAINELQIDKILLIGTSRKMVNYIASKLSLGEINQYIDINNIRSSHEINAALFVRKTQGKHVVPVPSFQIEQNFFKKLITKGTVIFAKDKMIGEKTIVQPNFHKDSIVISPDVFVKVVTHRAKTLSEVENYSNVKISISGLPVVKLHLNIKIPKDKALINIIINFQDKIKKDFLHYFNIDLYSVDIHIPKVSFVPNANSKEP